MADIAKRAGCHKSTVSLALKKHPAIPKSTGERIRSLAKEMGYIPDASLSLIASHRWNTSAPRGHTGVVIGMLVNRGKPFTTLERIYPAAVAAAESRGFTVELIHLDDYRNAKAATRVLYNRGIRGLLLPPFWPEEDMNALDWSAFTPVCCGQGWRSLPAHTVTFDWFKATQLAWRKVAEKGYRRIGAAVFSHQPPAEDDFFRIGASQAEQTLLLPAENHVPVLTCGHYDKAAFLAWMKEHRPDAIIGFSDGAYYWARDEGFPLPDKIGYASLNVSSAEIAGMPYDLPYVGAAAAEYLITLLHGNELGLPERPRTLLVEPEWHDGPSLPGRR
jgi:DNA-binding LacI/PurR family transcriptional regulator